MINLSRQVLNALEQSSRLEWLEVSGSGAFAMGTVAGMNTRRYHGLLVASLHPPVDRRVTLSRLEEQVDGVELGVNAYPGAIHPRGHERLSGASSRRWKMPMASSNLKTRTDRRTV